MSVKGSPGNKQHHSGANANVREFFIFHKTFSSRVLCIFSNVFIVVPHDFPHIVWHHHMLIQVHFDCIILITEGTLIGPLCAVAALNVTPQRVIACKHLATETTGVFLLSPVVFHLSSITKRGSGGYTLAGVAWPDWHCHHLESKKWISA